MKLFCELAFVDQSWQKNVSIDIDDRGNIVAIRTDSQLTSDEELVRGPVIPGMPNVHSHSFQRAFAGLSEFRSSKHDSFWTWRDLMYRFLERLSPDDIYVIARQLFVEMVCGGYTCVGEFQYIHNDVGGRGYSQRQIICDEIVRAATDAGISITMLPVLYQRSGFDGGQLEQGQKRFFLGDDEFVDLLLRLNSSWQENLDVTRGIAFHSLRAVDPAKIESVVESAARILGKCPCHIHVSEQQKEVDDCVAALGQTPVELLFESAKIDDRWCLIHATHATPPELALMSKSQSVVGLCPTTEANLGDGFFEAEKFKELGGRMGIGSDSHIAVDPRSELRLIEYAMRLREQRRAILCQDDVSCGQWLYTNFAANGARALGRLTGRIVVGNRADMVVLDNRHPAMFDSDPQTIFDKLVFFELRNPVARVMVGGKWSVNEGRHLLAEESLVAFNRLMKKLMA